MKRSLPIAMLLFFPMVLSAAGYFAFSPLATHAYRATISLKFDEARSSLQQLRQEEPDNLIRYHIENYIDFFTIFLNEDKEEFARLEKNKDRRLDLISKGDHSSPYYLYTQAEIKLQWALSRLKFEEYFTAFGEVRSAYKMLEKNERKFPEFIANKKSLGILHAMIGTVPDNYKWGVKLLGGMEGSIHEGRKEIEQVLKYSRRNDFIFEEETLFMYAMLLMHLDNKEQEAWQIIRSSKLDARKNPLACFVMANVAMHTDHSDDAIKLLLERPTGKGFYPFPYLDFLLGLCKLYRQDSDADIYIMRFISNFNGRNYIKEAYQKLAWHHLLRGDEATYKKTIAYCLTEGASVIGGDKNAEKEARSGQTPHPILLKARLQFDGGYYQKAKQTLLSVSADQFIKPEFELEYTYRQGRIAHRLKDYPAAIRYYQQTIDAGKNETFYYACNAALQLGLLYESQQNIDLAEKYFRLCQKMKPDDYQNSLHQKAKAGLNRLGRG